MTSWPEWEAALNQLSPPDHIVMGLDRSRQVLDRLQLEPRRARLCTVAGTNGKGSTVEALGALATAAGLRIGQYTSPHLFRFTERIRINGLEVDPSALARACDRVEAARESTFLTFFEFTTLAAFVLFSEADLDLWILEVGLGGRLDTVNLLDPDVSVIAAIGLDHQAILGHHIAAIAREKAGIMRAGRPAWTIDQEATPVLVEAAHQLGATLSVLTPKNTAAGDPGVIIAGVSYVFTGLSIPWQSAALALAAATTLGLTVESAVAVLQRVEVLGRLTARVDRRGVRWWFDVAHNPQAMAYVRARWDAYRVTGRRIVVLGLLADKDASGCLDALGESFDRLVIVGLSGARGRTAEALSAIATAGGRTVWQSFATLRDALTALPGDLHAEDAVLVLGSFYMVADALTHDNFL